VAYGIKFLSHNRANGRKSSGNNNAMQWRSNRLSRGDSEHTPDLSAIWTQQDVGSLPERRTRYMRTQLWKTKQARSSLRCSVVKKTKEDISMSLTLDQDVPFTNFSSFCQNKTALIGLEIPFIAVTCDKAGSKINF